MKRFKTMFYTLASLVVFMVFVPSSKIYAKSILIDVTVYNVGDSNTSYQINSNPFELNLFQESGTNYYLINGFPYSTVYIEVYNLSGNLLQTQTVEGVTLENNVRLNKGGLTADSLRYVYLSDVPSGGGSTPAPVYTGILGSIGSKVDISNSKLSELSSMLNDALGKMDITNQILGSIKSELQTNVEVPVEYEEDYTDDLEAARPSQNQQSFADNTQYFSAPAETVVSQTMPQATEPQQWDGVETPEAMQADESFSSESELFKDLENVKDIELTQDQFTKTEEMTQDNSYAADSPLTQDSFSADGEMTKDNYSADGEMTKDNFSNTEQYSKENEMQQTEIYNAIPNNPNLRWKSVKGQFQ